jgi:integrase/recombinase XerD
MPERDVFLLWVTYTTGIRVTELALLEVADVFYPSGAVKPEACAGLNLQRVQSA